MAASTQGDPDGCLSQRVNFAEIWLFYGKTTVNWSLLFSVLLMDGIIILINIPASLLGLTFDNEPNTQQLWFEPPGYVVPIIWFVLFTLMGLSRYVVVRQSDASVAGGIIIGFAVLCASYAFYTLGLSKITGISPLWFGV